MLRHYFLAVLPITYLLIARGLHQLGGSLRPTVWVVASACVLMNLVTNLNMFSYLSEGRGGGDYGSVLEDKASAVDWIAKEGGTQLSVDIAGSNEPLAYYFLFKQQLPVVFSEAEGVISGLDSTGPGPACKLIEVGPSSFAFSHQNEGLEFGRVRVVEVRPGCRSPLSPGSI